MGETLKILEDKISVPNWGREGLADKKLAFPIPLWKIWVKAEWGTEREANNQTILRQSKFSPSKDWFCFSVL